MLFPLERGTVVNWANLWTLVRQGYGDAVAKALEPFHAGVRKKNVNAAVRATHFMHHTRRLEMVALLFLTS